MPATVVVGTQWGDEGKGRFTDLFAKEMHVVVRYQGGHNAGTRSSLPTASASRCNSCRAASCTTTSPR